jgi:hypothetical protein
MLVRYICLFILPVIGACNKQTFDNRNAIVQVYNALDDNIVLYANLKDSRPAIFGSALEITNKNYLLRNMFTVNEFPQKFQFYSQKDTFAHNIPLIDTTLDVVNGAIYSLFIYGGNSNAAFTFIRDTIPQINRQGSSCFIRFANFSPDQSISINQPGKAPGSYVQSIPFKSLSVFTELPLSLDLPVYTFEVRNEQTGNLLYTYTIDANSSVLAMERWIHSSSTLVFSGHPGAAAPNGPIMHQMTHRFGR